MCADFFCCLFVLNLNQKESKLRKLGVGSIVASLAARRRLRWNSLACLGKAPASGVEGTEIHQVGVEDVIFKFKMKHQWGGDRWIMACQAGTRPSFSLLMDFLRSNVCSGFLLVPVPWGFFTFFLTFFFFSTPVFSQFYRKGDERCRIKL